MVRGISPDSDGEEVGSFSETAMNSSQSQSSISSGGSFSRLSFEASANAAAAAASSSELAAASSKPHRSADAGWAAILSRRRRNAGGRLGAGDFKLLRRVGSGDIGTVYLCRLRDDADDCRSFSSPPDAREASRAVAASPAFAMKVVDRDALARKKKKLGCTDVEREILRSLDHPFLPTLYADFDASPHYSCVVMEFCAGGDLHTLRHRQPGRRFSVSAARFYAAEVLVALEYLHMLGIVYRDLKPENVLIRSDGHIMLSDFDLSLQASTCPALEHLDGAAAGNQPTCFPDALLRRRRRVQPAEADRRRFVAEPVAARSCSFVGTHEYIAPEVAAGKAHGSGVDWWAYGVLIYELLFGRTPFAGPTNESTLRNIVKQPLVFPNSGDGDAAALIAALLVKDPGERLGSRRGATDVKSHAFFKGIRFALLRSDRPPCVPVPSRARSCRESRERPSPFDCF